MAQCLMQTLASSRLRLPIYRWAAEAQKMPCVRRRDRAAESLCLGAEPSPPGQFPEAVSSGGPPHPPSVLPWPAAQGHAALPWC